MDELSANAFASYRDLVYETEGFREFFRQMTPISEISGLKIGSRPSSRTKSTRIEDLRAIPWVFSWAQARVMLPGWFGVGHAITAFKDKALLADMARIWPFFQTMLRSEEHTSELQSLMRISYAVLCLKKKKTRYSTTIQKSTIIS